MDFCDKPVRERMRSLNELNPKKIKIKMQNKKQEKHGTNVRAQYISGMCVKVNGSPDMGLKKNVERGRRGERNSQGAQSALFSQINVTVSPQQSN